MAPLSTSAEIEQPGCCKSSLLLQSKLSHTPICPICWDPLVVTDGNYLEPKEVVIWKKCGHLHHRDCLHAVFGPLPRAGKHMPRRNRRDLDRWNQDEGEDIDAIAIDDDDEDFDDVNEDDEDEQKRLCPRCPTCSARDDACTLNLEMRKNCDPVMSVFLATDPNLETTVTPVAITIDGESRAKFDLGHTASQLGTEMDDLQDLISRLPGGRDAAAITRIKDRQLENLVNRLTKVKAEATLAAEIKKLRMKSMGKPDLLEDVVRMKSRLAAADATLASSMLVLVKKNKELVVAKDVSAKENAQLKLTMGALKKEKVKLSDAKGALAKQLDEATSCLDMERRDGRDAADMLVIEQRKNRQLQDRIDRLIYERAEGARISKAEQTFREIVTKRKAERKAEKKRKLRATRSIERMTSSVSPDSSDEEYGTSGAPFCATNRLSVGSATQNTNGNKMSLPKTVVAKQPQESAGSESEEIGSSGQRQGDSTPPHQVAGSKRKSSPIPPTRRIKGRIGATIDRILGANNSTEEE